MRAHWARFGPALFLIAYFFCFAGGGLWARFTGDDLMNLNFHLTPTFARLLGSNLAYWTTAYRPMGGIFYAAIYRLMGFHPLPFRVVCFALLLANLWLAYRVVLRLAESREVALLATLLVTYHAWMVNLYYSTGTIYELLCFGFYFAAFEYYLAIRQTGKRLDLRQLVCFLALYVGALDSKELAVTLPLCLAVYEAIWHGRKFDWRGPAIAALATVPYVIGKLSGPDSLAANPLYRPSISFSKFLHTLPIYVNVLFYQEHLFRGGNAMVLLIAMLALALWVRSRTLLFGWCFTLFSVLPFIFVPHYSGFFMYLPMVGWALYAATGLSMLRARFTPKIPVAAIFLALALALAPLHARESRHTKQVFDSAALPIPEMTAQLQRVEPAVPKGAHLYFASDPFPAHTFDLVFLVRLFYDDLSISVARAKDGDLPTGQHFDASFAWENGNLVRAAP